MEELLSDKSNFVKVNFNPKHKVNRELRHLLDMESTIKSCLDDLFNNKYLSQEDYKFLKPCGSKPRIMYGLCKVHKFDPVTRDMPPFRPFRPIFREQLFTFLSSDILEGKKRE